MTIFDGYESSLNDYQPLEIIEYINGDRTLKYRGGHSNSRGQLFATAWFLNWKKKTFYFCCLNVRVSKWLLVRNHSISKWWSLACIKEPFHSKEFMFIIFFLHFWFINKILCSQLNNHGIVFCFNFGLSVNFFFLNILLGNNTHNKEKHADFMSICCYIRSN